MVYARIAPHQAVPVRRSPLSFSDSPRVPPMKRALLCFAAATASITAAQAVELTILTGNGHVAFSAVDEWPVVAAQTHLPTAVMAFQIPNSADEGTPDSTNLSLSLYDLGTPQGQKAFAALHVPSDSTPCPASAIDAWETSCTKARQGDTTYTIMDARRHEVADVAVNVRLAWPHLSSNPGDYDTRMKAVFRDFVLSVHGAKGPYEPRNGEVAMRPGS